jgi:hypothetical protein
VPKASFEMLNFKKIAFLLDITLQFGTIFIHINL